MELNNEDRDKKKRHREPLSGRKAEKKKTKKEPILEQRDKQKNLKAFAFNSAVKAERRFRRTQDIQTKKQHIPVVDRTPLEPPPIMVVVVGPPKVGKSTLIQCLVKSFTRQPLTSIKGPITVVSGKKRRITLMECNNDINSMIDLAKVADLVLLLIDASFGFEMEIFEFLNICQVHGMPKVMGVLTHLDMLKQTKILKRTKKMLKHRFWTEVYAGAKVFYLSGLLHGEYLRNEIKNLGRFISVMKFRPLTWQTTHSYLVVDRMEDLTSPELIRQNPKVDRTVSLYGFVRGIPLNKSNSVHIPGCGDSVIGDICYLPDPCPLPDKLKKRSLVDKERLIYAPLSGVGGIVYDKDAVYIELAGSHSHHNQVGGKDESERELVTSLLETKNTLDSKIAMSQLQIFSNTAPITAEDFNLNSIKQIEHNVAIEEDNRDRRKVFFESDQDGIINANPENKIINYDNKNNNVMGYLEIDKEVSDVKKSIANSDEDEKCSNCPSKGIDTFLSAKKQRNNIESFINITPKKTQYKINNKRKHSNEDNIKDYIHSEIDPEISCKITNAKSSVEDLCSNDEECPSIVQKERNPSHNNHSTIRYEPVQAGRNKEIRNKIHEALDELQSSSKKRISLDVTDPNFSDDESSYCSDNITQVNSSLEEMSDNELNSIIKSDGSDVNQDNTLYMEELNHSNGNGKNITDITWKTNLAQKAADSYFERHNSMANLWKLVYGEEVPEEKLEKNVDDETHNFAGMFTSVVEKQEKKSVEKDMLNAFDTSILLVSQLRDWSNEQVQETIKDCFVTGKWKCTENASDLLQLDDISEDEDDVYGDYVDFETGEKSSSIQKHREKEVRMSGENNHDTKKIVEKQTGKPMTKDELMEKKRKLKEKFDAEYDEKEDEDNSFYASWKKEASMQTELNRMQFDGLDDAVRVQIEGFRAGVYVRVELQHIPCELVTHFNPTYPLIIGSLQPGEENVGFLKVRIKKHRWCKKILKTRDPLIVSMGWRRFQTLAIYSKLEDNLRHRMLKYTPEHVICMAHFWGPITRPNTGFLAVQDVATKQEGFRIVATGSVVDCNKSTDVTKKLKLTGVPFKIYKKTAFIRGMFNSALEVAKFEGGRIKTVSGIRGIIKKAVSKPEGAFRATFEDKIQLSDIVFCRTWYKVEIPKLYNPVTSLLLPLDEKNLWHGMKTVGQLKREKGLKSDPQRDSFYTPIEREPIEFKPLMIPRKLQKNLPFKDKPKVLALEKKKEKVSVVRDNYESKVASMMKKMRTIYNKKQEEVRKAKVKRLREFKRQIDFEERKKLQRQRKMRKNVFRALSKSEKKET